MPRSISLIDTTGAAFPLTWPYLVGNAPSLWGSPPVLYREDEWPGGPGSLLTEVRHGAREAVLPITIVAETALEADEKLSELLRAVDPTKGPLRVVVTRDDGTQRELSAYAVGGFEGLAYTKAHSSAVTIPLRLYAANPYWRAVVETETRFANTAWGVGLGSTRYNDPIRYGAPLPYTGVTIAGHITSTLTVVGDVPAWPRFELTGPANAIELVNHHPDSHQGMYFEDVLTADQRLIIETEPGRRMVTVDGTPSFSSMGDGWEWWSLRPGSNEIGINVESYGSTTALEVTFREEFLSA